MVELEVSETRASGRARRACVSGRVRRVCVCAHCSEQRTANSEHQGGGGGPRKKMSFWKTFTLGEHFPETVFILVFEAPFFSRHGVTLFGVNHTHEV